MFIERTQWESQDRSGIGSAHQQWKLGERAFGLRLERVDPLPFGVSSLAHEGVIGFGDQKYSWRANVFWSAPVPCRFARPDCFSSGHRFGESLGGKCSPNLRNPTGCNTAQDEPQKSTKAKRNTPKNKRKQRRATESTRMQGRTETPTEKKEDARCIAAARWSFVCQQNYKCIARTSLVFTLDT